MNHVPKVNIITPVYNGEKYIDRFYTSIQAIEYENLSVILVNDGSSDKTDTMITTLCERDSRITYINKLQNEGVSKARNDALRVADGEYCFFFDCDDTVEPSIVRKCIDCAESKKCDAVLYVVNNVTHDGKVCPFAFQYEKDMYNGSEAVDVVAKSFGISIDELMEYLQGKRSAREGKQRNGPWRMMYRLKIIDENALRFPEQLRVGEDTVFTNEYLLYCERIGILRESLYYAWENGVSTIHTYHRNIGGMVSEKVKIVHEKMDMTERMFRNKGCDISSRWGGETILSSVQLAWLLACDEELPFREKRCLFKEYHYDSIVQKMWKKITVTGLLACISVKTIPVILLKLRMDSLVLVTMVIMKKLNIHIQV